MKTAKPTTNRIGQEPQPDVKKRIASLVSNILSPFLIGLILIPVASLAATTSVSDAIKWSLILITLNILPIFLAAVYLVKHNRLDSIFANVRQQRTKVYPLAAILAGISCIILLFLEAPLMLLALFIADFSINVIFMGINLRWKISVHTAFITTAVAVLFVLYGFISMAFIVLIPLVAWAKIELGHHSLAQVITGALSAISILMAILYPFGLI